MDKSETPMPGSLHPLVGRLGRLRVEQAIIPVKIIAVDATQLCPKCGGPWGTTETQKTAMIGGGRMVLDGTTAEGCLNDVKLEPPNVSDERLGR